MRHDVSETDTATALGSGDVPVLGTPRLVAWMEAATVAAAAPFVEDGQTTVGTSIRVEHHRPTPIGGSVDITATTASASGRRLTFTVHAVDATGELVGSGEIDRVVVDRARFLAAAEQQTGDTA